MKSAPKKKSKESALLKLNLGAGQNPHEDFVGVDNVKGPGVRYVVDLFKTPWPFKSDSVDEVYSSHFFEHVPGKLRMKFMDELWRVMKMNAKATFITPYWSSERAIQDPTHEWPPICGASYAYFNEGWRRMNGLGHYLGSCNFDFGYGYHYIPEHGSKTEEVRLFAANHYINAVADLQVTLTKIPKLPKQ